MTGAPGADDLCRAGLRREEAVRKAALFAQAGAALALDARTPWPGATAGAAIHWLWVPGRIEVLGKHTDYAGGRSLLCATERGLCLAVRPRPDRLLRIHDLRWRESVEGEVSPALEAPVGHWANYPFTVARRVARNFPAARRGADLVITGDLPPAAGLSSSSALVVATFLALSAVNDLRGDPAVQNELATPEALAGYLGAVESGDSYGTLEGERGVGTSGGSEDHTAILCGRAGALVQYGFRPVRLERIVALPPGLVFAVATSGVAAEKTGAARAHYNAASRKARLLLEVWQQGTDRHDPSLAAALRSSPDAAGRLRALAGAASLEDVSSADLQRRLDQFIDESEVLVPAAADALEAGNLARFGEVVARSQEAAERGLMNSVPETEALVRSARDLGAVAASAFGAGFGGSVWALVAADEARGFLARWRADHERRFAAPAREAEFFETQAGPAARPLFQLQPADRRPG